MSRRTVLFLAALGLVTFGIVVHDVWRPVPSRRAPDEPSNSTAEPTQAPTVARALSRAALVYPGEFANDLAARLRLALAVAEPAGQDTSEPAVMLGARRAIVAAGSSAETWVVRTDTRTIQARLSGVDAVHGIAVLHLDEDAPGTIAFQDAAPATPEPIVAMRPQVGLPAMQYLPASSLRLRERVMRTSIEPGDTIVDLDGRMVGFVGRTAYGPAGLEAALVREIASALGDEGRHAHPWLGADVQTVTPALRHRFPQGSLVVVFVWPESHAAGAGLRPGQAFAAAQTGGHRFTTAESLLEALRPGEIVQFEPEAGKRAIGVTVDDLQTSRHEAADPRGIRLESEDGVPLVVSPGSDAASAGLMTGDRVEAIDLRPARSALVQQLLKRGVPALLTVKRGHRRRFVWLPSQAPTSPRVGSRGSVAR